MDATQSPFAVGDRCKTRDGRAVRVIWTDVDGWFPLVAVVAMFDCGREEVILYHGNGRLAGRLADRLDDPLDLMPDTVERESGRVA